MRRKMLVLLFTNIFLCVCVDDCERNAHGYKCDMIILDNVDSRLTIFKAI